MKKKLILIILGFLLLAVVLSILGLNGIRIPCIFKTITSLSCPGCGNTRAAISLLKFDIISAFKYNALFIIEFSYLIWVFTFTIKNYTKTQSFRYKSPAIIVDIIVLCLIVAWFIIRNILKI